MPEFDVTAYATAVLEKFQHMQIALEKIDRIQHDLENVRESIDKLQTTVLDVGIMADRLRSAQTELNNIQQELGEVKKEFIKFQRDGGEKDGDVKTQIALLKQNIERTSTNRSILISTIIGILMLFLSQIISKL